MSNVACWIILSPFCFGKERIFVFQIRSLRIVEHRQHYMPSGHTFCVFQINVAIMQEINRTIIIYFTNKHINLVFIESEGYLDVIQMQFALIDVLH